MFEKIEAVIFDLDGTLVDSMWMWKDIDIEYLQQFEISLPEDLQQAIEGMSFTETAHYFKERFGLAQSVDEIKSQWTKMAYDKYKNQVSLKPGARRFLQYLDEQGYKVGIATSNVIDLVRTVTDANDITGFLAAIRTGCEVDQGKPAPDIYLKVAEDLGVSPEHCLVFEDVPMGIAAGKRAGMRVCAVYDEHSRDQDEKKAEMADYYIHTYDDIFNRYTGKESRVLWN